MGMVASRKQETNGGRAGGGGGVSWREKRLARGDVTREKHGSFWMLPEAAA